MAVMVNASDTKEVRSSSTRREGVPSLPGESFGVLAEVGSGEGMFCMRLSEYIKPSPSWLPLPKLGRGSEAAELIVSHRFAVRNNQFGFSS
jgi:hypothetical protein